MFILMMTGGSLASTHATEQHHDVFILHQHKQCFQIASPLEQKVFWKQKLKCSETSFHSFETCRWSFHVMSVLSKYPEHRMLMDSLVPMFQTPDADYEVGWPERAVLQVLCGLRRLWVSTGTAVKAADERGEWRESRELCFSELTVWASW